ncbi:MAG: hypothetical protein IJG24_09560, partial [Selenomonadaceae bacterium]|nr:hypothetical protein [Selenomonadaceae bacterium]
DPEMQTLQLKSSHCPDYNLLMTLLFTRYAPDLLKIRFDKFHEAPDFENLIPYAKKINDRFPRHHMTTDKVDWGGGDFIYSRVICKQKKSSPKARTIQAFPQICYKNV